MRVISKKIVHQSLACASALFVQFLMGIGWGWIAPTLLKLQSVDSDFRISIGEAAWLGSISEIGSIIGSFLSPILLDNVGRKNTLVLVSIVFSLNWATIIFIRNIHILLATRIVCGIGNGVIDVTSGIYVTEICSPNFRGIGGSALLFTFFAGMIFASFLTTYESYANAAIVITIIAICAVISTYFGVETTYFLTMKGKLERAKKNLAWLEASSEIEDEFEKIRKNVEEERQKRQSIRLLFTSAANLKALFTVVVFHLLYSFVGFHAVMPYASLIFSPSKEFTSNEYTILLGIVQFPVLIFSIFVVEKIDRRPMIIFSFVVTACCNMSSAVLLYLHRKNYNIASYPWLLFLSIALYISIGSFISPVMHFIPAELLPLSVRAIGGSMAITASSTGSFIAAILFWPITGFFGMEINFVLYAVASSLVAIFVHVAVTETRGKSLHEMHEKAVGIENPCANFDT